LLDKLVDTEFRCRGDQPKDRVSQPFSSYL